MTLTDLEKLLLASVLADRDRLASQSPIWDRGEDRHLFARRRCAIEDARRGIVAIDWSGWIGHAVAPAERQARSRAVRRLIALELLIGYGHSNIKALSLTEAGKAAATELATEGKTK